MRLSALLIVIFIGAILFGCASAPKAQPQANPEQAIQVQPQAPEPPMHIKEMNISREIRGPLLTTDTVMPVQTHADFMNRTTADGKPIVYYFYSPHCSACMALQPEIDRLKADFDAVEWREYDISSANGSAAYNDFTTQWNLSPNQMYTPQVLVNGTIITDRFKINATLEPMLEELTGR